METSDIIRKLISKKISLLNNGSPESRGNLAKLRRGLGKDMAESGESWQFVYSDIPEALLCKGADLSEAEIAIYTTLTIYAMHQQGLQESVHIKNIGFGHAVSEIISSDKGNEDAVIRRFNSLITSDGIIELSTHLRSMVQLMKSSERIKGFDYEVFAVDLYYFQYPEGKKNVKLKWGKQFYNKEKENLEMKGSE